MNKVLKRRINASYDAVQTNDDNERHWENTDALSPDESNSPYIRNIARNRSRYECANNPILGGVLHSLALDIVGPRGPRLQMLLENEEANKTIENGFKTWAKKIKLAKKLRTMMLSRVRDGECFGVIFYNPMVAHAVKLDLLLVEPEMVTSDYMGLEDEKNIDGVHLDDYGNIEKYQILKHHPGSQYADNSDYAFFPAKYVVHSFQLDRAGQHRGIPEILPGLPMHTLIRRYALATISCAESNANMNMVIQTTAPAGDESAMVEPFDQFPLYRNSGMALPEGWTNAPVDRANIPPTTYREFHDTNVNDAARCVGMPLNRALLNSKDFNYSSARADNLPYRDVLEANREDLETDIIDQIFELWIQEYNLINSIMLELPEFLEYGLPHKWFWPGQRQVDPLKSANAKMVLLNNHLATYADLYAEMGMDYVEKFNQIAREQKLKKELGIEDNVVTPSLRKSVMQDKEEGKK